MKIAVFSDIHFGYAWGSERQEDSFMQGKEAFEIALANQADAIYLLGDLFDVKIPQPEVVEGALRIFRDVKDKSSQRKDYPLLLSRTGKPLELKERDGIPIIAIHGTHDQRSSDFKNPVEVLETAGMLTYLRKDWAELEKQGEEKVYLHGMSGVPDRYAKETLDKGISEGIYAPVKPGVNLLGFHQTFTDFLPAYDDEPGVLSVNDLPKGFDLYLNGHFHWAQEVPLHDTMFLMCGSTVLTQMKQTESEIKKRVYFYDTVTKKHSYQELQTPRPFYYKRLDLNSAEPSKALKEVEAFILDSIARPNPRKPMIRVRVLGSLAKGFTPTDLDISSLEAKYKDKAILSLSKDLVSESLREKIMELRQAHNTKLNPEQLGQQLLDDTLKEMNFKGLIDKDKLLALLAEGEDEKAWREIEH